VLYPLYEIAPDLVIPQSGGGSVPLEQLVQACKDKTIKRAKNTYAG